jgi:hypothetical protein
VYQSGLRGNVMIDWHATAKDFAGPVATVVASVTAACVTYLFANKQVRVAESQALTAKASMEIAKSQRDIALDKLKGDLFQRRYETYKAGLELCESLFTMDVANYPIHDPKIRALRIRLEEATFLFAPAEVAIFDQIEKLVQEHEGARIVWRHHNDEDSVRRREGDRMADALDKLRAVYLDLPKSF